nr:unnamed protein product [Spirometra erinaceieuropaei]
MSEGQEISWQSDQQEIRSSVMIPTPSPRQASVTDVRLAAHERRSAPQSCTRTQHKVGQGGGNSLTDGVGRGNLIQCDCRGEMVAEEEEEEEEEEKKKKKQGGE